MHDPNEDEDVIAQVLHKQQAKAFLANTKELLLSTCKKLNKDGLYDMLPLETALWYDQHKIEDEHRQENIRRKIAELEIEKQKLEQQLDD